MNKMSKIKSYDSNKWFDFNNYTLLTIMTLITLYPLIFVISASISDPMEVYQGNMWLLPKGITMEGYIRIFKESQIWIGYKNTIIYTIVGTAINIFMTICAAYPLSRKDLVGKNLIVTYMTITMFFGGGLIPTYLLIKNLNMLNSIWVMVLPGAVSFWNIIITRTYIQTNIPEELRESAMIDGCTNIRYLLKILLPLSAPILAVMTLFYAVGHWNAFFNALIYITDEAKFPLQLVLRRILISSQATDGASVNDLSSLIEKQRISDLIKYCVIVVGSAPVLILYPMLQKYFAKGIMIGSVKG